MKRPPSPPSLPPAVRAGLVEALARLLIADLEREQAAEHEHHASTSPNGGAA